MARPRPLPPNRRVIEESPNGIIIHQGDQGSAIRFVNPAGLHMFGHTEAAQMIGRPMLDYVAAGDRDLVRERISARLRSALPPGLIQVEALRADGSSFWINAAATVVDWEGHPATLVSFVDVSEQRRLQTAEREAESLRAVTRLANAAAHEINNPLTVVGGNIHLLAAKLNGRVEDVDFNPDDFIARVNADLIGKYVNIASRAVKFVPAGKLVAGDSDSYRYLAESIRVHPDQQELKALMQKEGFGHVDFHNLTGGVVALHVGIKC